MGEERCRYGKDEEWEGEREEVGAEGDGRRGVGKGDGEEVLHVYAITCSYTLLFQSNRPKPMTTAVLH